MDELEWRALLDRFFGSLLIDLLKTKNKMY